MERHFFRARLARYRTACDGDAGLAISDYSWNILLAEAMVPMLSVLEIALRNALHRHLVQRYAREDWWQIWDGNPCFTKLLRSVDEVCSKLASRREKATPDKIIAELTFGFWSSLFDAQYQDELWKDLRLAFPWCPKHQRQRRTISAALNQVRDLRNRVFHHEPLLWLVPDLRNQHARGIMLVNWLDPQLGRWLDGHDRLASIWEADGYHHADRRS